jgi:hypothetical protein
MSARSRSHDRKANMAFAVQPVILQSCPVQRQWRKLRAFVCTWRECNIKYVQSRHLVQAVNFWLKLNLDKPTLLPHEGCTMQIADSCTWKWLNVNTLIVRKERQCNIANQLDATSNSIYWSSRSAQHVSDKHDGFGGLVVSMLASGSRIRGFESDRNRWIFFRCEKILSMPSFGGEVK